MPFANLKVPAGLIGPEEKERLVVKVTELYVELFGEEARANTMVLVDEVADGGWGIRGDVLTLAKLRAKP
ncbi:4-oxalocrotonate tautomerase [Crossiella equi]|uniref:4-oxalocrotonate tautomerase n=1 Tax=Crossiella equi TaxID=130796 RepID=A0ABS5AT20_9PSEU|nr:tautomerase family protein [Crossiella equi]MBP2478825.1 4-oxalocrotonate tautomerase [Crossiella equi]